MYIKINGSNKKYKNIDIIPFTTQHGNDGVRIIGDVPQTDKGFKLFDDNDEVLGDYSDYNFEYAPGKYTAVEEEIEVPQCSFEPLPDSPYTRLSRRVSRLSSAVSNNSYSISEMEDALCEYTTETEDRITDAEDAICELSEIINPETLEEEE